MAEQIGIKLALDGTTAVQTGLRGVSDALGNLGTRTLSVADAFKSLGPQLAATLSVGAITAWARGAVNAIDAMNDLADATGATVEQISALDGFARRTGTTLDSVGSILVKFNGVLNQTGADNGVSQALRAIGLDTAALRRADPVQALQQTAQALSQYADDGNKARLVQELFGKSIREAAPILKDLAEAGKLNATVTAQQAAEAEKFNRALSQFKANAEDAGRAIVTALLPSINDLVQQLRDGLKAYESFWKAAIDIGLNVNPFKSLNENLTDTVGEIKRYRDVIAELSSSRLPDPFGTRAQRIEKYQQQLTTALAREQYLLRQLGREPGRSADPRARPGAALPSVPTVGPAADPLSAIRDPRAQYRAEFLRSEKAVYAELEKEAQRAIEDERKRQAGYAEWQLQQSDEVARTLIDHEQMVADYMRQQAEVRQAELRLRATQELAQIARADEAQTQADNAAARAAQERADSDLREHMAALQRYDNLVNAAEEAYRTQTAGYNEYVLTLTDDTTRALIALNEYEADWLKRDDEDRRKRAAAAAEYELDLQDDVTRTLIAGEAAVAKFLEDNTEARKRALDSLGERINQMRIEAEATDLAAKQSISLAEAIEMIAIARLREQQVMYREGTEGWNSVQAEIDARQRLLALMGDARVRDANLRAAQEAAATWQRTVDQVGQSLADALMNGGKSAGEALKRYFGTLVLQPIIQALVNPVARTIVGGLGLAGAAGSAAAGSAAGAAGGGAATGLGALLATGSAYGSFVGAGASMALSGGTSAALAAANAAMQGGSVGAGLSIGAGAIAPWVAAGALIVSGLSRRLKDTGIRGSFGGAEGFAGSQYAFYKGGFLRSNRTTLNALDPDTQALLAGSFQQLRASTTAMARELGLAADALDSYTKSIDISLRGLTQEQIAERLGKELGLVADEMARLVGGAGATADSLRQLYQAVMSERANLETQLLQLQGNTAELRRREREALHESNRALYDRIIALQDERTAMEATLGAAQSAIQQQISASQSAANAARQAAEAYRSAGLTLMDTARALRGEAAPGVNAAAAYRAGLAAARGGDVSAMQGLSALAQTYAESLRGSARSRSQYLAGTRSIAAELEAVAGTAGGLSTQRSVQAALLDTNTAVLQVLAEDLQNGNLTVDLLQEHSRSLAAIAAALGNTGPVVQRLIGVDEGTSGVVDAQQIAGDLLASSDLTLARVLAKLSAPDANFAALTERVGSGNQLIADRLSAVIAAIGAQTAAQQAEIKRQQDLAKAQKDLESAFGYLGSLQSSLSNAQATLAGTSPTMSVRVGTRYDFLGLPKGGRYEERTNPAYQTAVDAVNAAQQTLATYAPQVDALRQLIRSLGGVPQFAAGGLHSGGMRLVGERGPELEVTGPARYWSAADTTAMLGNSQRREQMLAAEIRALRAEVQGLRSEARATAENTGKTQRLMQRVTRDGESMQVTDVTPTP